jgi:hypothetical protein
VKFIFVFFLFIIIVTCKVHAQSTLLLRKTSQDSIIHHTGKNRHFIHSLQNWSDLKNDSIIKITNTSKEKVNHVNARLDSIHQSLTQQYDSLTALSKPDTILLAKISKVKSSVDSLKSKITNTSLSTSAKSAVDKIEGASQRIESEISGKLSLFQKNGALKDVSPQLPNVPSLPVPTASVPDINVGGISSPSIDAIASPNVNLKIQETVPSINNIGALKDVRSAGSDISELKNNATQNIDKLNTENLEQKVVSLKQAEGLQEQLALADKAKRFSDPDVVKAEVLNKAKTEAVNHFSGHENELKTAMEKLSNAKVKAPDKEEVVDLFSKESQRLKNKPVIERLLPGFTFQFQNRQSFWLDLNPYIGYKLTHKFWVGVGWNERMPFNFKLNKWDRANHIYGVRSFINFKLKENLYLKVDLEAMNGPIRPHGFKSTEEIVSRKWILTAFAGIKKDFKFSKAMKGNVQMLYNFVNTKDSPYTNQFNIRMGFELPLQRKKTD